MLSNPARLTVLPHEARVLERVQKRKEIVWCMRSHSDKLKIKSAIQQEYKMVRKILLNYLLNFFRTDDSTQRVIKEKKKHIKG